MKPINFKEMYNAGVHLGSSVKTINPKMKPYIMCTHDGIAIIDILKTYTRLFWVTLFLKKVIATEGYQVLFVGTQKSIAPLIADVAIKCSSPYVNERWKGGFLTNFKTMKRQKKNNLLHNIISDKSENWLVNELQADSNRKSSIEKKDFFETKEKETIQNFENLNNWEKNSSLAPKSDKITKISPLTELTKLPDIVIIVGQQKELKAVKECQILNIPTITILDSDGDPEKTSVRVVK